MKNHLRTLAAQLVPPEEATEHHVDLVERALTVYRKQIIRAVETLPVDLVDGGEVALIDRADVLLILRGEGGSN